MKLQPDKNSHRYCSPVSSPKHSSPCTLRSEIRKIGQYNPNLRTFKTVQCCALLKCKKNRLCFFTDPKMARKSAQPTSDTECINVSMGAPLCFQSRLRSSYIYDGLECIHTYIRIHIFKKPGTYKLASGMCLASKYLIIRYSFLYTCYYHK